MQQSPGKIFLAEQRGLTEDAAERRYSTFNYAEYYNEHKQPFGPLKIFNDEMLAAGSALKQQVMADGFMVLLPVTGAIIYNYAGETMEADAGETLLIPVKKGQIFGITNPYINHWVNFLLLQIEAQDISSSKIELLKFDIATDHNKLVAVADDPALPFAMYIGRFAGRNEATYKLSSENASIFSFVLAGAFELQNRLLHERDGLALWDVNEVEAEALSNDAVLLMIELK